MGDVANPESPRTWRRLALPCPPRRLPLVRGEIHVWRLDLAVPAYQLSQLHRTLDDDERARGARLLFERDRGRFISVHGLVRRLLSSYLGLKPEALSFDRGSRGKPRIVGGPADTGPPLHFNQSASGDTALLAVSLDREVGVDLEKIRAERDCVGIAERSFPRADAAALRGLSADRLVPAFYRCWTRREACVKATGDGLLFPLNAFALPASSPRAAVAIDAPAGVSPSAAERDRRRCQMLEVTEIVGFAAALAVETDEAYRSGSTVTSWEPAVQFLTIR